MIKRILFLVLGFVAICCGVVFVVVGVLNNDLKTVPEWVPLSFCKTMDTEPPVITLNGEEVLAVKIGESYEELGASVEDDCDSVELEKTGEVDTSTAGVYNIVFKSVDNSGNVAEITRIVNVVPEYRGTIYLTFDDGPGPYTAELLDILAKYNVKATFFVTGGGDDAMIAREYNEGHTVALHTFTHDYAYVYQSTSAFFDDLYKIQQRVKNITGQTVYLMRFPGGSSNTVSTRYDGGTRIMTKLASEVTAKGFIYFDWNVSSGDAGGTTSADGVFENVVYALKEGGSSVVLQHDVKGFSVAAVERIIRYGLKNGYVFDKLDASSFTARHRINN